MKRIYPLLVVCFVLMLAVTVYAQRRDGGQPVERTALSEMFAKVERLEDQVARLEAQVRDLRGRRSIITVPTVPAVPGNALPKGWQEREFNGLRYYIVPCEAETTTVAAPATRPVK